jgi:hypothetical protein
MIAELMGIVRKSEGSNVRVGPRAQDLRRAKVCYDHLAGELAVILLDRLKEEKYIKEEQGN